MNKKIIKVMAVLQMLLAIVAYISMGYHFDNDRKIYRLLANTDFVATILRLALYAVPGIHLLSGLYGLVFSDKGILTIIAIVETISCGLSFMYVGSSQYMLILSIISTLISLIYLISTFTMKQK